MRGLDPEQAKQLGPALRAIGDTCFGVGEAGPGGEESPKTQGPKQPP